MKRFSTRAGAMALALALIVGACGGDDDSNAADINDDTTTTAAPGDDTTTPGEPVTDPSEAGAAAVPESTGPADDSLEPVVIGMASMDEGTPSYPDVSAGVDAAVALINAELGGIQGHPVEIRHCNVGVDQASNQECAQELANDDDVHVVIQGYAFGSAFMHPIFEAAGLPTLLQTPITAADFEAQLAWAFQGGNLGGTAGAAGYAAKVLDAQNIVALGTDLDSTRSIFDTMKALPSMEGRNFTTTLINDSSADLTADVQVSGATEADAVLVLINAHHCVQMAQTLKALNVTAPIIAITTCATPTTLEEDPTVFEGWRIVGSGLPPLLAEGESPELDYFREKLPEYGDEAYLQSFQGLGGFGAMLAMREIGNELPESMTRDDWAAGLEGFTGPYFGGKAEVACPGSVAPAVCDHDVRVYELDDSGVATLVEPFFDAIG